MPPSLEHASRGKTRVGFCSLRGDPKATGSILERIPGRARTGHAS